MIEATLQSQNKMDELLTLLDRTNSLFTGHSDIPLERMIIHIAFSALERDFDLAVWVCLRDSPQTIHRKLETYGHPLVQEKLWILDAVSGYSKIEYPHVIPCRTKDYTGIMINLLKLLSDSHKPLIIIDSIGYLAIVENISTISRFWRYLSQQVKKRNGTIITYLYRGAVERSVETAVQELTDRVFRVDENEIKYEIDSIEGSIPYKFTDRNILLGKEAVNIEEKTIRELERLFTLTKEEKHQLEQEIEEIHREITEGD